MCKEPFNETFRENILLITIARFFFSADQRESTRWASNGGRPFVHLVSWRLSLLLMPLGRVYKFAVWLGLAKRAELGRGQDQTQTCAWVGHSFSQGVELCSNKNCKRWHSTMKAVREEHVFDDCQCSNYRNNLQKYMQIPCFKPVSTFSKCLILVGRQKLILNYSSITLTC